MTVHIDSTRFGPLDIAEEQVLEFPDGLIGIPGSGYALLDLTPGGVFRWLQSMQEPGFALPVVDPFSVLSTFAIEIDSAERERIGLQEVSSAAVYVTVHAAPNPAETTVNLRAPIVISGRRGFQVINSAEGAELRSPLIAPSSSRSSTPMSAA